MAKKLRAPFPFFGGKYRVADVIWRRFGDVGSYLEPFCGSCAVLLARPDDHAREYEAVNDADGFIVNFWRAVQRDPEQTAHYAYNPPFECDYHARHAWVNNQRTELVERIEGDPDYYDVKIAGWWVWCQGMRVTSFCNRDGAWHVVDGKLVKIPKSGERCNGIDRSLPLFARRPIGIANKSLGEIIDWFHRLADRLKQVCVACGDWTRILGKSFTVLHGTVGVFLDPPYKPNLRCKSLYSVDADCSDQVRKWAIEHGENPAFRICLAGFADEHEMPSNWTVYRWTGLGLGAIRGKPNRFKETLWFSPHCLKDDD